MKTLEDNWRFSSIESDEHSEGFLGQEAAQRERRELFLQKALYPTAQNDAMNGVGLTPAMEKIQKPQPQGLNRKERRINAKRMRNENA